MHYFPHSSFLSFQTNKQNRVLTNFLQRNNVLVAFLSLFNFSTILAILLLLDACITTVYIHALKMSSCLIILSGINLFKTIQTYIVHSESRMTLNFYIFCTCHKKNPVSDDGTSLPKPRVPDLKQNRWPLTAGHTSLLFKCM